MTLSTYGGVLVSQGDHALLRLDRAPAMVGAQRRFCLGARFSAHQQHPEQRAQIPLRMGSALRETDRLPAPFRATMGIDFGYDGMPIPAEEAGSRNSINVATGV